MYSPTDVAELQCLVREKQALIDQHEKSLAATQTRLALLEERLRLPNQKSYAKRSEKHPGQAELQFLNEAELLHAEEALKKSEQAESDAQNETDSDDETPVSAHKRKRKRAASTRELPPDLPRCEVIHDLTDEEKACSCGLTLHPIGEEVLEQLCILPQQFYVIVHRKLKYGCSCKACMRTAAMPVQPIPGSQASPQIMAHVMVSKFHDGLPLHRQEKMAKREGLDLDRTKLARWTIAGGKLLQPVWNCLQDSFYNYDIALADETGIQVLKETGRKPEAKSKRSRHRKSTPNGKSWRYRYGTHF